MMQAGWFVSLSFFTLNYTTLIYGPAANSVTQNLGLMSAVYKPSFQVPQCELNTNVGKCCFGLE